MAKRKLFFQKEKNRQALLVGLMVALFILALDALRYATDVIVVKWLGYKQEWGYLAAFVIATVIILYFIIYLDTKKNLFS